MIHEDDLGPKGRPLAGIFTLICLSLLPVGTPSGEAV